MRNKNMMIVLALLAAAALFYFMRQSDFMKTRSASSEVATSMDVEMEEEEMDGYPDPDEDMDGYPDEDESMMMMSEEEAD